MPLVAWVRGSESPGLITGVGVTEQPIDGGVGDRLEHVFVEAGRIRVRGQRDGALLVGGVHQVVEGFGGLG